MENPIGQSVEQNDFTQTENKAKLWQLLQRNGAFNGIDSNYFNKVREDFEINVIKIQSQYGNIPLMDRNKLFLDVMIDLMKKFKNQPIYTSADIQKSKRDAFDNDLSKKQNEFNHFNAKPTPPDVNFADKEEDSGDVNTMLEQVIRDRESVGFSHPPPTSNKEVEIIKVNSNIPIKSQGDIDQDQNHESLKKNNISLDSDILNEILEKLTRIEKIIVKNSEN